MASEVAARGQNAPDTRSRRVYKCDNRLTPGLAEVARQAAVFTSLLVDLLGLRGFRIPVLKT